MKNLELAATNPATQAFIDALALISYPALFNVDLTQLDTYRQVFTAACEFAKAHSFTSLWNQVTRRISPDMYAVEGEIIRLAALVKGKALTNDNTLTARDLDFLRSWRVYMTSQSEASEKGLLRFVGLTASARVASLFTSEEDIDPRAQQALVAAAEEFVQHLGGTKGASTLDLAQSQAAREKSPEVYKQFLAVRAKIREFTTNTTNQITRKAGAPVPVRDIIRELDRLGIEHSLPAGFVGKKDERGFYTMWDEPVNGTPVGEVKMNPAYTRGSHKYVFQTMAPGATTYQTVSTRAAHEAKRADKYARVASANDNIDRYMSIWRRDLMSADATREELGCITEMLYLTTSRIGSPGNSAKGQDTFGLSTLLGKNIDVKGSGNSTRIRITYLQKKASEMTHIIEPTDKYSQKVNRLLAQYKTEAGDNGRIFHSTAAEINAYIKNHVKLPLTAHGFRYLRGTQTMVAALATEREKLGAKPREADVVKAFNAASKQVGALLGHSTGAGEVTGATAVKSYIDPAVSRGWFEEFGMRPPRNLE